jgi:hypothetical protein
LEVYLIMYLWCLWYGYLEMYVIYPLRRFWEIFSTHVLRTIEDVTPISWIFILFACFIALIFNHTTKRSCDLCSTSFVDRVSFPICWPHDLLVVWLKLWFLCLFYFKDVVFFLSFLLLLEIYSIRFKMSVTLANWTHIKEWNEIIIRHNIFTKLPLLYEKKYKLKVELKIVILQILAT